MKPYNNHGKIKCMKNCSSSNNNKIYCKQDGKECFSSCKDIDDGQYYTKLDTTSHDYILFLK